MMGWGYDGGMMSSLAGFGFIVSLIVVVDLVLVGIWLWQQITKK